MESTTHTDDDQTMRTAEILVGSSVVLGVLTVAGMQYKGFNVGEVPLKPASISAVLLILVGFSQFSATAMSLLERTKWVIVSIIMFAAVTIPTLTTSETQVGIVVGIAVGGFVAGILFTLAIR